MAGRFYRGPEDADQEQARLAERGYAVPLPRGTHPPPQPPRVQKNAPERVHSQPAPSGSSEYDLLLKLMRSERALIAAGTRGEAVAEQLQDVRNSIRAIIEQRGAEPAIRVQPYERER